MADDVTFTAAADATPPAGTKAATDEITAGAHTGAHAGIAKLAVSADGDGTHLPATAADGLLVNLGANNDVTVSGTVSVTEPVSVDDNGGSLTVDAPVGTPVAVRIGDGVDQANVTAAGEVNVLASAQPGTDIGDVTVNNAAGAAAVNIQDGGNSITVDGTVSVTEPVSVDDNGGSLTVDAPLATPVHTRISDGTDAVNVSAAGALQVDGSAVTQPVSAASLPLPTGAATSANQLPDGHNVTVDNAAGAAAVNVQDGGNSLTVDGTVTANQGSAGTAWEVIGDVASDAPAPANPVVTGGRGSGAVPTPISTDGDAVHNWLDAHGAQMMRLVDVDGTDIVDATDNALRVTVTPNPAEVIGDVAADIAVNANPVTTGGRASTAIPSAVSGDGDAAHIWLNRQGMQMVSAAPHMGLFGSQPWNLTSETAQYTGTQTSTVLVAGGASERIVVTSIQIQVGGTTAGTLQVYFGTGAYVRGTNLAIFDGEFAPSATLKPGVVMQGPFISPTNGDDILVTDSAAINPLTITVWYYVVT